MSVPNSFSLLEELKTRAPLIGDGEISSVFQKFGITNKEVSCVMNLDAPEQVRQAYKVFQRSGSEMLKTNTANAHPLFLESLSLEERGEAINNSGMALLRESLGTSVVAAGHICGIETSKEDAAREHAYGQQIVYLSDTMADVLWLTEFDTIEELKRIGRIIRRNSLKESVFHLRLQPDGSYEKLAEQMVSILKEATDRYIGVQTYPLQPQLMSIVHQLVEACGVVSIVLDELPGYNEPSKLFQQKVEQLLEMEIAMISGGKNTTPEHIKHIHRAVQIEN